MAKLTEVELLSKIIELKKEFNDQNTGRTMKEHLALRDKILRLHEEYQQSIIDGCNPCPTCGHLPLGLHLQKRIKYIDENGNLQVLNAPYEIGCAHGCVNPESKNADREQNPRTWGLTREDTVKNWNSGKYYLRVYPTEPNVIVLGKKEFKATIKA